MKTTWQIWSLCFTLSFIIETDSHNLPHFNIYQFTTDYASKFPFYSGYFYPGLSSLYDGDDRNNDRDSVIINKVPVISYGTSYFYDTGSGGSVNLNSQCPVIKSNCGTNLYRSFDGSCNNLQKPLLGAANTQYGRLLPPKYSDGVGSPPLSVTGEPLPNPRILSISIFPNFEVEDHFLTLATMQWGQLVTHDMSFASGSSLSEQRAGRCCGNDGSSQGAVNFQNGPQECFPVFVPQDDVLAQHFGSQCVTFARTRTDRLLGCPMRRKSAEQVSIVNHWLDGSIVYGSDDETARSLRTFSKGKLITESREGREWPPTNVNRSMICEGLSQNGFGSCYASGYKNLVKRGIIYNDNKYGYVDDYDENVDPSVLNEHATAAFRLFHTNIQGFIELVSENRFNHGSIRLSDHYNDPTIIEESNNFDDLVRGLASQPQRATDQYLTSEVTDFLFRNGETIGFDLKTIDIQRGRDHGLPSYNDLRAYCGFKRAENFNDFLDHIDLENVNRLKKYYAHPDDVDLVVGGAIEKLVPETISGPTYLCIMLEQFYRTRVSDRFFYERGNNVGSFTPAQLIEIKKSSLARLLCDNSDKVLSMQPKAFQVLTE
ncbi:Peroxidase precursor, putative [Pediculus humanus corporis]|uniref:Peroxidase, putative n=1 Tax=Pediculus humanus subsp. corporis TaxID=121224 RepID=E0VD07_PEDHC|nr:Peroxidase precursor, putative [Pediculus humanus corporis]EEB11263.1 Peroxidase precursor, putative [Pediculus humanus corporis]